MPFKTENKRKFAISPRPDLPCKGSFQPLSYDFRPLTFTARASAGLFDVPSSMFVPCFWRCFCPFALDGARGRQRKNDKMPRYRPSGGVGHSDRIGDKANVKGDFRGEAGRGAPGLSEWRRLVIGWGAIGRRIIGRPIGNDVAGGQQITHALVAAPPQPGIEPVAAIGLFLAVALFMHKIGKAALAVFGGAGAVAPLHMSVIGTGNLDLGRWGQIAGSAIKPPTESARSIKSAFSACISSVWVMPRRRYSRQPSSIQFRMPYFFAS